ncbi:hypothetical protein [Chryseobacterium sp. T1]
MKKFNTVLFIVLSVFFYKVSAQIGINSATPTEVLDVNGTTRIRSLPPIGTSNSIYTTGTDTSNGLAPSEVFNGSTMIYSDANGVLGKSTSTTSNLMPNNTTTGFNTSDTSTAMFVIKRFTVADWPSSGGGLSTGMSVAGWEAIMSNIQFNIPTNASTENIFAANALHNYRLLGPANDVWKIIGDINAISDGNKSVDILFIKKTITASDARTN